MGSSVTLGEITATYTILLYNSENCTEIDLQKMCAYVKKYQPTSQVLLV